LEQGSGLGLAPGLVIGGKYRLEAPLAKGGMGSVWLARHAQLDVEVAIKFMDPAQAASAISRARFEREAKAAATLRSPHVVHVQDYGLVSSVPYLVMERLRGEDLHEKFQREGRLSLQTIAEIIAQVARGLKRAHDAGLIHRDLKPRNIFLAKTDEGEIVKILDFGVAKETVTKFVGEATNTGELVGSPHFMSPEQIRAAKDLDPRSDVWALGVITFRALVGKLPFRGQAFGEVLSQILTDPIPVPSHIAPDLSPDIDRFIARALSRDRDQRFQSARELSDALNALASAQGYAPRAPMDSYTFDAPPLPHAPRPHAADEAPTLLRSTHELLQAVQIPSHTPQPASASAFATPQPASASAFATPQPASAGAFATPQPASVGTLANAGGAAESPSPARPRSGIWLALIMATALVVGGGMAALLLRSNSPREPMAATQAQAPAPPAPIPSAAPPLAETAAPAEPPAATAAPSSSTEASAAPPASVSAELKRPLPTSTARPPTAASTKRPSWGF